MRYREHEEQLSHCYSAVLMDVMDAMDTRYQCMGPEIGPLDPSMRAWGEAVTIYLEAASEAPPEPYQLEMEMIDDILPGQIIVAQCNMGQRCAFWGGLLSNAAVGRECAGIVTDGPSRDYVEIVELGFPVFCTGLSPYDSLARLEGKDRNVPVVCGGIRVVPGDLVFADVDGTVVVPQAIAEEVIDKAWTKVRGESLVREELRSGASVVETFKKYGIL